MAGMTTTSTPFYSGVSSNKPPLFDGSNYSHWKYRMEIHLQGVDYDLWEVTINGPHIPMKKKDDGTEVAKTPAEYTQADKAKISLNKRALGILLCSLNATEHSRVIGSKSAYDVWKKLEVTHEGTNQVKDAKINMLLHEFECFKMQPGESIQNMGERYNNIMNRLSLLDNHFTEKQKVDKILRSLTKDWQPKVTAINEVRSLKAITLEELMGNLLTHEMSMSEYDKEEKPRKSIALKAEKSESSEEDEDFGLLVRKFKKFLKKKEFKRSQNPPKGKDRNKCFKCGSKDHFIADCPQKDEDDKKYKKPADRRPKRRWQLRHLHGAIYSQIQTMKNQIKEKYQTTR